MGGKDEPLRGFSWKGGVKRDTSGIIVWSDIFLHEAKGKKLAIILMDTQGLFDTKTSPTENSRIFALGTLASSIQIFNLNDVIQENQLEYLQVICQPDEHDHVIIIYFTNSLLRNFHNLQ